MNRGQNLVIAALEKELERLKKKHIKADAEYQKGLNACHDLIGIKRELIKLLKSSPGTMPATNEELNRLKQREKQATSAGKKDIKVLMDKELDAKFDVEYFQQELETIKFSWRYL